MAATKINLNQIDNASANSKLLGSGASGSGAPFAEITLGTNLSMSGTTLNAAGGGTPTFADITSGTNTTAAMVVGSGASLSTSGTGTIAATTVVTNANLTGDVTSVGNATTIGLNKVTNSMLSTVATQTFKGRTTASTGNVEDLTATQATAILNAVVGDSGSGGTKGLVPAPASGDAAAGKFLKADGTFAVPNNFVINETPSGSYNGSNVTFTLANTPLAGIILTIVPSGLTLTSGAGNDYTVSGNTITMAVAPTSGESLRASYGSATVASVVSLSAVNTFTAAQRNSVTTLTDAATIAIDLNLNNDFKVILGGNRTLGVPTNFPSSAAQDGTIDVWQDSTGSRTLAYSWVYEFAGNLAPVLSTGKFRFDQLYYRVNYYATSTVTISNATPAVVTWANHGLNSGQKLQLATTGTLPTGLSPSTTYWVNVTGANTFNLSSSLANLQAGTYIATSSAGSGTHTAVAASITINSGLAIS